MSKNLPQKRAGRVAQCVGLEFKLQNPKKKKKTEVMPIEKFNTNKAHKIQSTLINSMCQQI
jgi:hypothetical protein